LLIGLLNALTGNVKIFFIKLNPYKFAAKLCAYESLHNLLSPHTRRANCMALAKQLNRLDKRLFFGKSLKALRAA